MTAKEYLKSKMNREEEKFLLSTFGEQYEEYRKKTRRYL